jgi:hypothetical protein
MDDSTRYRTGEWALSGFDLSANSGVVHYSAHWCLVPHARKLELLQAWIDQMSEDYDHLVADEPERENDDSSGVP